MGNFWAWLTDWFRRHFNPQPKPQPVPSPIPKPPPTPVPPPIPVPPLTPKPPPVPPPVPVPAPSGSWGGTHIPFELPGGLTALQADAILRLVSIAENDTTDWWTQYTYIEDIGDGRGYTINIVGFCTGTSDFLWLVENLQTFAPSHPLVGLLPALKAVDGTASHAGLSTLPGLIKGLGADPDYLKATWNAIIHFYWGPAAQQAAALGLKNPISLGQLYDIALNMGDLTLLSKIKSVPPSKGGDEKVWLTELQAVWLNQITKVDKSLDEGQPDRAKMWQSILAAGNVTLARPITGLVCYGDQFTIS